MAELTTGISMGWTLNFASGAKTFSCIIRIRQNHVVPDKYAVNQFIRLQCWNEHAALHANLDFNPADKKFGKLAGAILMGQSFRETKINYSASSFLGGSIFQFG
jgi:hypothetical protein